MKATRKMDTWQVISFVILALYALFLVLPLCLLLRSSVGLAALALLAVCAWLGNAGRNNKMFYIPMAFMLAVTLASLVMTLVSKVQLLLGPAQTLALQAGGAFGVVAQVAIALLLLALAVVLAVRGVKVLLDLRRREQ